MPPRRLGWSIRASTAVRVAFVSCTASLAGVAASTTGATLAISSSSVLIRRRALPRFLRVERLNALLQPFDATPLLTDREDGRFGLGRQGRSTGHAVPSECGLFGFGGTQDDLRCAPSRQRNFCGGYEAGRPQWLKPIPGWNRSIEERARAPSRHWLYAPVSKARMLTSKPARSFPGLATVDTQPRLQLLRHAPSYSISPMVSGIMPPQPSPLEVVLINSPDMPYFARDTPRICRDTQFNSYSCRA
jgi:hypothetical protein